MTDNVIYGIDFKARLDHDTAPSEILPTWELVRHDDGTVSTRYPLLIIRDAPSEYQAPVKDEA